MGVKVDYKNAIKGTDANGHALDLDTIYITAGGFIRRPFKGISRDSLGGINETVWGGDLTRSRGAFALSNIDKVDFGVVPRCEISFKYMNVQDYLDFCKIAKERVMIVDFFNRDLGQRQTLEMAMTNQDRGNLYNYGAQEYIGNLDIKIKLVATNREYMNKGAVTYMIQYVIGSATWKTAEAVFSSLYKLENIPSGEPYSRWETADGRRYLPRQEITIWQNLTLYARS